MNISLINSLKTIEVDNLPVLINNHQSNLKQSFISSDPFISAEHSIEELCRLAKNINFIKNNLSNISSNKIVSIPKIISKYFNFLEVIYLAFNRFIISQKMKSTMFKIKNEIQNRLESFKSIEDFEKVYGDFSFDITPYLSKNKFARIQEIYHSSVQNFSSYYQSQQQFEKKDEQNYFEKEKIFLNLIEEQKILGLIQENFSKQPTAIDKVKYLKSSIQTLANFIDSDKVKMDGRKTIRATAEDDDIFIMTTIILKSHSFEFFKEISSLRMEEIYLNNLNDDERGTLHKTITTVHTAIAYIFSNPYQSNQ